MSSSGLHRGPHHTLPWLREVSLEARPAVGSKAAVLGALMGAGIPIPDGFCIPSSVVERLFSAGRGGAHWQVLQAAYEQLTKDGGPVVVRSSAAGEDSRSASFAGLFETVTGIQQWDELVAALQRCWQSASAQRVKLYRERRETPPGALSVLIQRQVDAQVSGVLFTRDPVTGASSPLLVEAAAGLGEDLLGGRVSPWQVRLERTGEAQFGADEAGHQALAQVPWRRLAELAEEIEGCLGPGQDVEWAYGASGGADQLWILQARPVTTGAPPPDDRHFWTRANVAEVLPDPVTPLTWSVFQRTLLGHRRGDGEYVRRINGRVYVRLDGMLASLSYLPGVTPQVMSQVLGVPVPEAVLPFSRQAALPVRLAQGLFLMDAVGGLPRLQRLLERLPALPPAGVSSLPDLLDWTTRCFHLHLKTTAYAIGAYAALYQLLQRWMPSEQEADRLAALLHGQASLQTAAQGRELWRIATELRSSPPLAGLVSARLPWKIFAWQAERLEGGRVFLQQMEQFLEANGARAAGEFELARPRWREDPQAVMAVLANYLSAQQDGTYLDGGIQQALAHRRQEAAAQIKRELNPLQWWTVAHLLSSYERYTTWRENVKYRLMEGYARLRLSFLELGGQMVEAGTLQEQADIFYLRLEELPGLESSTEPVPDGAVMDARRREHSTWQDAPAPPLWTPQTSKAAVEAAGAQLELKGIGCSAGVVEGRARVIWQVEQGRLIQAGEVLVAPHTDPGWTPLFLTCAAVVTEVGGFLSHGATVAREYGLPCVVNVPGVTRRIRTGDRVRVDGGTGQVWLLEQGEDGA
jgi:rifampicin phosphotransferase